MATWLVAKMIDDLPWSSAYRWLMMGQPSGRVSVSSFSALSWASWPASPRVWGCGWLLQAVHPVRLASSACRHSMLGLDWHRCFARGRSWAALVLCGAALGLRREHGHCRLLLGGRSRHQMLGGVGAVGLAAQLDFFPSLAPRKSWAVWV